jgi:hypothetical protein
MPNEHDKAARPRVSSEELWATHQQDVIRLSKQREAVSPFFRTPFIVWL